VLDGVQIPRGKGQFWEKRGAHCKVYRDTLRSPEPIDLPFGLWTRVGQRKQKFNRIRQVVPMYLTRGHIGTSWRIRLNRPSAATMRSYVKLL